MFTCAKEGVCRSGARKESTCLDVEKVETVRELTALLDLIFFRRIEVCREVEQEGASRYQISGRSDKVCMGAGIREGV